MATLPSDLAKLPPALAPAFADAYRRRILNNQEPVSLTLHPVQAWALLCSLQQGIRCADPTSPNARLAHGCARQLQERIAPDGALAAVAELGWAD